MRALQQRRAARGPNQISSVSTPLYLGAREIFTALARERLFAISASAPQPIRPPLAPWVFLAGAAKFVHGGAPVCDGLGRDSFAGKRLVLRLWQDAPKLVTNDALSRGSVICRCLQTETPFCLRALYATSVTSFLQFRAWRAGFPALVAPACRAGCTRAPKTVPGGQV